jgi:hypothetical protein
MTQPVNLGASWSWAEHSDVIAADRLRGRPARFSFHSPWLSVGATVNQHVGVQVDPLALGRLDEVRRDCVRAAGVCVCVCVCEMRRERRVSR